MKRRPYELKAYVSAASRGLAFEAVKALAREGAELAISSRNADRLDQAKSSILTEMPNAKVLTIVADLSTAEGQDHVLKTLDANCFSPDVFVCSAGHAARKRIEEIDRLEYGSGLAMILDQAVFTTRAFLPRMVARGWGRIIYVSSVHAKYPSVLPPEFFVSSIARCGLLALTKFIQQQYAATGIAVFSVALGYVDTPMLRNAALGRSVDSDEPGALDEARWAQRYAEWVRSIPAGRIADASEFGDLVRFLVSDPADYLNGQVFNFSGGLDGGII